MVNRKKKLSKKRLKREKLIPLLPNIITTCSMTLGLASIMQSLQILSAKVTPGFPLDKLHDKFWWAAGFIALAIVFDMLDGKIARALGSESKFGVSYDSLSDMVSFGVAPAVLVYVWCLMNTGEMGLMALLLYIVCVALRLARFNIQVNDEEKHSFSGLPSPMAAGLMFAPIMLLADFHRLPTQEIVWYYLTLPPIVGILMVSNIPYRKIYTLKMKGQFNVLVIAAIIITAVASNPSAMVIIIVYSYFLSGLGIYVYNFIKKRSTWEKSEAEKKYTNSVNPKT